MRHLQKAEGKELRPSQSLSWQNSQVLCSTGIGAGVLNNLDERRALRRTLSFFSGQVLDATVPGLGHDLELNALSG